MGCTQAKPTHNQTNTSKPNHKQSNNNKNK